MTSRTSNPPLARITAYTLTSALGVGNAAALEALRSERGALRQRALRGGGCKKK